jgi:hypothetical protein
LVNIFIPRLAVWDAALILVILGVKLTVPVSWVVVLVAAIATLLLILSEIYVDVLDPDDLH